MDREFAIYREILENLIDGVMVIDFSGSITVVNEAACRIFNLDREAVLERSFAEVFIQFEGFDEFSEIVFEATMQQGNVDKRVSQVEIQGQQRSITISTSYLSKTQNGRDEPVAVIAVFTDISEVKELRETELRLAKENESQHRELQKAFGNIQSTNAELSQMIKKVRIARSMVTIVFVGLFLLVGNFYLQPLDSFNLRPLDSLVDAVASVISNEEPVEIQVEPVIDVATFTVSPSPLNSTISLRGYLAPGHVVNVSSPIEGHIKHVYWQVGQAVQKGDKLLELDTEQLQIEFRQKQVDYIKKKEHLSKLEDWENSTEVADAKRSYQRAKLALDNVKKQLDRNNFLLEQGIIPSSQQEEAQRSYASQLLDFEAATESLAKVRNRADPEEQRVAVLEVENSYSQLLKLEEKLKNSSVVAPISGIVQEPPAGGEQKPLNVGRSVTQGELLLNIANFDQIAVSTTVNEIDVGKIHANQSAWITGPGFPNLKLEGKVTNVAARAISSRHRRESPQFEINVALNELSASHRDVIRVGMSAHVTIVVYDQPEALLIPIDAVNYQNNKTWVNILDAETGNIEQRFVELGLTTLDSVEVLKGISNGEQVVVSRI